MYWNGASYPWADARAVVPGQPGVTQSGSHIVLVHQNYDGKLYLRKGDNCLANEF